MRGRIYAAHEERIQVNNAIREKVYMCMWYWLGARSEYFLAAFHIRFSYCHNRTFRSLVAAAVLLLIEVKSCSVLQRSYYLSPPWSVRVVSLPPSSSSTPASSRRVLCDVG